MTFYPLQWAQCGLEAINSRANLCLVMVKVFCLTYFMSLYLKKLKILKTFHDIKVVLEYNSELPKFFR